MIAVFFLLATIVTTGLAAADGHPAADGHHVTHHGPNVTHHGTNATHHGSSPHHTTGGNSNAHRFLIDKKGNRVPIVEGEVAYEITDKEVETSTTVTESTKHKKKGLVGLVGGVVKGVGGVVKDVGGVVDDLGTAL